MAKSDERGILLGGAVAIFHATGGSKVPENISARVSPGVLYHGQRRRPGYVDAFRATMAEVLTGLIGRTCFACTDDIVMRAKDAEALTYGLEGVW